MRAFADCAGSSAAGSPRSEARSPTCRTRRSRPSSRLPGVTGVSLDRAGDRHDGADRRHGRRELGPRHARSRRHGRRHRGHRLGRRQLARRPRHRAQSPASWTSSISSPPPTTTTATAPTSPASSRATATTPTAAAAASRRARRCSSRRCSTPTGQGYISNVIAAIDYAIAQQATRCDIRVINLSVAAGVYESYTTDPLTLAAKRAVEAGLVVVSAAGNLGATARRQDAVRRHRRAGQRAVGDHGRRVEPQRHGQSHPTTRLRRSARAVRASIDFQAKPDLVAPGVGIESLAEAGSTLCEHQARDAAVGHGRDGDASRTCR